MLENNSGDKTLSKRYSESERQSAHKALSALEEFLIRNKIILDRIEHECESIENELVLLQPQLDELRELIELLPDDDDTKTYE